MSLHTAEHRDDLTTKCRCGLRDPTSFSLLSALLLHVDTLAARLRIPTKVLG